MEKILETKIEKITEITMDYIEAYCVEHNETDWLVDLVQQTEPRKIKGSDAVTEQPISMMSIRSKFARKFMPEIVKTKESGNTFRDRILEKYKK